MSDKQRTFGQFPTPPDVADLLLAFCQRRPFDRLLDPSCGAGAFLERAALWQRWLADDPDAIPADLLWGVELDEETAVVARNNLPQAQIISHNFFTLSPGETPQFDAIIGNPPYTRAEWIGRLNRLAGEQLFLEIKNKSQKHQEPKDENGEEKDKKTAAHSGPLRLNQKENTAVD